MITKKCGFTSTRTHFAHAGGKIHDTSNSISFEVGPVIKQPPVSRLVATKPMYNMAKRVDTHLSERLNNVARNRTTNSGKLRGTTVSHRSKHPATYPLP